MRGLQVENLLSLPFFEAKLLFLYTANPAEIELLLLYFHISCIEQLLFHRSLKILSSPGFLCLALKYKPYVFFLLHNSI